MKAPANTSYKPSVIAIDYETADSRGASFEYFRKDFRIFSMSCAWRAEDGSIQHWFSTDDLKIRQKLAGFAQTQIPIVAHNLPYELGVTNAVYPHLKGKLNWHADTMRLCQLRDGGGDEFGEPTLSMEQEIALELGEMSDEDVKSAYRKTIGLSLEACAARFLDGDFHNHKKAAHDWIQANVGVKRGFGQYLDKLPYELLEQYNNADTTVTLMLYEDCIQAFKAMDNFNWGQDNQLYLTRARLMSEAYARGIRIDTEALFEYILKIEQEIVDIEKEFKSKFAPELEKVAALRYAALEEWAADPALKSDRARERRKNDLLAGKFNDKWQDVNVGSSLQLFMLFGTVMGMSPTFLTKKGSPSFKSTHLHQWGEGGSILLKRRKRLLVLQQCVNCYIGSLYDGRIHCSVKVSGTRTNRVAGGRV